MASTMRFDKWENTLGQPYGTVLQVIQVFNGTNTVYGSGNYAVMTASVTPKMANSKIYIASVVSHGFNASSDNNDNWDISFWYRRNGSTVIGNNPDTTRNGYGGGEFMYATDVQGNSQSTYRLGYETTQRAFNYLDSPSYSLGAAVTYELMIRVQTAAWINRSSTAATSGSVSSMTIMEIAN